MSPFCYDQQRKMLQRPIIFAGTSQSPARRSCIHGVRGRDPSMASADGEAASMASAASGAASMASAARGATSMASADLRRARAAELHPWRPLFLGKRRRPARAPTGDEGTPRWCFKLGRFLARYGVVSAALGGGDNVSARGRRELSESFFYLDLTVFAI